MKRMRQQNDAASMEMKEIDEALSDLEKEKSDREFEEYYNRERFYMAEKLGRKVRQEGADDEEGGGGEQYDVPGEMPLRVHFRRPPKTADEAIQTLKEAD